MTARPGRAAPAGTRLNLRSFDAGGNFIQPLPGIPLSGAQDTLWPWNFNQPGIIEMCLEVPGASRFQTALIAIGSQATASKAQYSAQAFADAYRVGDRPSTVVDHTVGAVPRRRQTLDREFGFVPPDVDKALPRSRPITNPGPA